MPGASSWGQARGALHSQLTWLCAAFVLTGVVNTLLGPFLPVAIRKWQLSEAIAGLFFPSQFAAGMAGTLCFAWITARIGLNWCLSISLFFMAAGVATAAAISARGALASVACWGFGLGLNIPAANSLAARSAPGGPEVRVTALNFAWGVGAALGPAILTRGFAEWSLGGPLMALAGVLLAASLAAVRLFPPGGLTDEAGRAEGGEAPPLRITLLAAALLFFYVGTESAFSGWLALAAGREYDFGIIASGLVLSVFWAAFIAVRGLVPVLLRYLRASLCVQGGMMMFMAGALLVIAGQRQAHVVCGAVLAGCGLGPVFPLVLSAFYRASGTSATGHISAVFAGSALGGACIPPLVGLFASATGSIRLGIAVVLAASAMVLMLRGRLMDRTSD